MKLLLQTSMIFFGTLLAAGLIALGEPAESEVHMIGAQNYVAMISDVMEQAGR